MLLELNISPFSAWETSLSKIEDDDRFRVFSKTKYKKLAFEAYCQEQAKVKRETKVNVRCDQVYLHFYKLNLISPPWKLSGKWLKRK
jgi:hypothetical protein